jgi:CRP-like cAMP-binding protein
MTVAPFVRIAEADPDLVAGLDPERRQLARRHLVAEMAVLRRGEPVDGVCGDRDPDDLLGLLIVEGLVLRRVELLGRSGVEILGPGDVLRPWQFDGDLGSVPAEAEYRVCEAASLAILDPDVQAVLHRFPSVVRELFARAVQRTNTLALNLALAQLPRVDARLLVLFWHLADRFGNVHAQSVKVPVRLSHATLAELVYARRPSVTTALGRLAERGLVSRGRDGQWTLHGPPPSEPGRRPAAARRAAGPTAPSARWPRRRSRPPAARRARSSTPCAERTTTS